MSIKIILSDSAIALPLTCFEKFPSSRVMAMANSFEDGKELEVEMPLLSLKEFAAWLDLVNRCDRLTDELRKKLDVYGLTNEGLFYYSNHLMEKTKNKEKRMIKFMSKGGFFPCKSLKKFEMMKKNVFNTKEYIPCRMSVSFTSSGGDITHVMMSESLLIHISDKLTERVLDVNRVKYDAFWAECWDENLYESCRKDHEEDIDYDKIEDDESESLYVPDPSDCNPTLIPRLFHSDPSVVMTAVGYMATLLEGYEAEVPVACPLFYKTYDEMKLKPREIVLEYSPNEVRKVIIENNNKILKNATKTCGECYLEMASWGDKGECINKHCISYGFVKL